MNIRIYLLSFTLFFSLGLVCCKTASDISEENEYKKAKDSVDYQNASFYENQFSDSPAKAPAYPGIIKYQQPDGSVISIFLKGDERINWAETKDGYTLLMTDDGEYQYAMQDDDGNLVLSGIKASPLNNRTEEEIIFLHNTPRNLFFSDEQIEEMKEAWNDN